VGAGYEVQAKTWANSGHGISDAGDGLAKHVDTLCAALVDAGACWGSDDIGRAFCDGDSQNMGFAAARDGVLSDLADMVNVLRATGALLVVAGNNYQVAEDASTVGPHLPAGADQDALAQQNPYYLPSTTVNLVESDPPQGIDQEFLGFLESVGFGVAYPDGNMAKLASMREALTTAAEAVNNVGQEVGGHVYTVAANNSGDATDAFKSFAAALQGGGESGGLEFLEQQLTALASAVTMVIEQKNAAREQFWLAIAFLAVTWAAAAAISWITGGESLIEALFATKEEGVITNAAFVKIAEGVASGLWFGAGMDVVGQFSKMDNHLQKGFSFKEVAEQGLGGAVAGGLTGFMGHRVGLKNTPLTKGLSELMESQGLKGYGSRLAFNAGVGTVSNLATQGVSVVLGEQKGIDVKQAVEFGVGMAGIDTFKEAGKSAAAKFGSPSPGNRPTPPDPTGGPDGQASQTNLASTQQPDPAATGETPGGQSGPDHQGPPPPPPHGPPVTGADENPAPTGGEVKAPQPPPSQEPPTGGQPPVPDPAASRTPPATDPTGGQVPPVPDAPGHQPGPDLNGQQPDPVAGQVPPVPDVPGHQPGPEMPGGLQPGSEPHVPPAGADQVGALPPPPAPQPDGGGGHGLPEGSSPQPPAGQHPVGPEGGPSGEHGGGGNQQLSSTPPAVMEQSPISAQESAFRAVTEARQAVAPDALWMTDGGMRVTDAGGRSVLLTPDALNRTTDALTSRAADGATPERLRAEAAAQLGGEVARATGGSAADGALDSLRRLADQSPETADAANAVAREVLAGNPDHPSAGLQDPVSAPDPVLRPSVQKTEADDISRRIGELGTAPASTPQTIEAGPSHAPTTPPGHQASPGVPLPEPRHEGDLSLPELHSAMGDLQPSDFGRGVTGWHWSEDGSTLFVETEKWGEQAFHVQVGDPTMSELSQTHLGTGTEPHQVEVAPWAMSKEAARAAGLDPAQVAEAARVLPRALTHEITDALQRVAAQDARSGQGVIRRILSRAKATDSREAYLAAGLNKHRFLDRQWRATDDPAERTRIGQEINALAADLRGHGHDAPVPPWDSRSEGTTPPPRVKAPEPVTPHSELVEQVRGLTDALGKDVNALHDRADARLKAAQAAYDAGDQARAKAQGADEQHDSGHVARRRQAEGESRKADDSNRRNLQITDRYLKAEEHAVTARDAYRKLLDHLENHANDPQAAETAARLAEEAQARLGEYHAKLGEAIPPEDVLPGSMPTGRLPHLKALTETVNRTLADAGVNHRYTPEALSHALRAGFRKAVSPDGVVLRVGKGQVAELHIQLHASDLVEVLDPQVAHGESMVGRLPQGGETTSATAAYGRGLSVGPDLGKLASLLPEHTGNHWIDLVKRVATHVDPSLKLSLGQQRSVTGNAMEYATFGGVEDNRGEATLFDSTAAWEVKARSSHGADWTPTERVDTGVQDDATSLRTWVSHAYTVEASHDTVQLAPDERFQTPFPEHVATGLTGLGELHDKTVRAIEQEHGSLGDIAHNQLRTMLTDGLPSHLHEAVNGGWSDVITDGGRPVALVRVDTKVIVEKTTMVGEASTEHWQERLRVGFTGATGGESMGVSTSVEGDISFSSIENLPEQSTLGAGASLNKGVSHSDSSSAGGVAIHPSVQRYTGETQGYRLRLQHEVTVDLVGKGKTLDLAPVEGDALVRIPETDAYRYGLPVEAAAIKEGSGTSAVLRGDPSPETPPGRKGELPPFIGDGPDQMRGAGPALVQRVTHADGLLPEVENQLRAQGVLPALDEHGRPQWSSDPVEQAAQMENARKVADQLSPRRLETGYDQASQDGIFVDLVRMRPFHEPEHFTMRIRLEQDFNGSSYIGLSTSDSVVNLDIASFTTGMSHSDTRSLTIASGLSAGHSPGKGPGEGGSLGGGVRRNVSTTKGWSAGDTGNEVTLTEGAGPSAVFSVPHKLHVEMLEGEGTTTPLIPPHEGSARVLWPSDMLPETNPRHGVIIEPSHPAADPSRPGVDPSRSGVDPKSSEGDQGQSPRGTHAEVFDRATVQHVDASGILDKARGLFRGLKLDSPAIHHLASFLSVRSLVANTEGLHTTYETSVIVRPEGLQPRSENLSVDWKVGESSFVSAHDLVTGDINLTLSSSGVSESRSHGWTADGSAGGSVQMRDGSDYGMSVNGSHGGSHSTSDSELDIWGRERLTIETGKQYSFTAPVEYHLRNGESGAEVSHSGNMVYTLPERDALGLYVDQKLNLPLDQVGDAVERFRNGSLNLDRNAATPLVNRYIHDVAAARAQGAHVPFSAEHTPEVLGRLLEHAAGVDPLTSSSAEHRLDGNLAPARSLAAGDKVALPEHFQRTVGTSTVESLRFTEGGRPRNLFDGVMKAVGTKVTDAELKNDPVLRQGLFGTFAGRRSWGHVDKAIDDPGGFVKRFPVVVDPATGRADLITVRVRMKLGDQPEYVGHSKDVVQIVQDYRYRELDHSETTGRTNGLGVGGSEPGRGKGAADNESLGTGRARSVTGSQGEQLTKLQRYAQFNGVDMVRQKANVEITVERTPLPSGPVRSLPRRVADAFRADAPKAIDHSPGKVELHGEMVRLLPAGMTKYAEQHAPEPAGTAGDGRQAAESAAPTIDPRQADMTGVRFQTNSTTGENTHKVLVDNLASRKMFGGRARAGIEEKVARVWSATARNTLLGPALGDGGHPLPAIQIGHDRVDVQIEGRLSDLKLVTGLDNSQLGEVDRIQQVTGIAASPGRALPLDRGIGGSDGETGISLGLSSGAQASEGSSMGNGNRDEASIFENQEVVTVRARVDYDLTFTKDGHQVRATSHDNAYITMFRHDYDAVRARQEAGAESAQPWRLDPPVRPGRWAPSEPDWKQKNADPGKLMAPLRTARMEAMLSGKDVYIEVHQQDGESHRYVAGADGSVRSGDAGTDGGFVVAYGTLPPSILELAESEHLDLRQLFNSTQGQPGTFTEKVGTALKSMNVQVPGEAPTWQGAPRDPHRSPNTHTGTDTGVGGFDSGVSGL
jgi:hypothetical protein